MTASGAVQTSVNVNPALGQPGELYDSGPTDKVTRVASVGIPFGSYVKLTAGQNCTLPSASGDVGVDGGIALIDPSKPTGVGYEIGDVVTVLRKGRVWVESDTAITELSVPYVRYTAGSGGTAGTVPGGFAGATDASKNVQPSAGMVALTATTAAGVVAIDINYPQ